MHGDPNESFEIWSDEEVIYSSQQVSKSLQNDQRFNAVSQSMPLVANSLNDFTLIDEDNYPQLSSLVGSQPVIPIHSTSNPDQIKLIQSYSKKIPGTPPLDLEVQNTLPTYLCKEVIPNIKLLDQQSTSKQLDVSPPLVHEGPEMNENEPFKTFSSLTPNTQTDILSDFSNETIKRSTIDDPKDVLESTDESTPIQKSKVWVVIPPKNNRVFNDSMISDQSEPDGASNKQGYNARRYPSRARNPNSLFPFSRTRWINWRTEVPKESDLNVLKEPVEGFDIPASSQQHSGDSESIDEEFVPDEPLNMAASPLLSPEVVFDAHPTPRSDFLVELSPDDNDAPIQSKRRLNTSKKPQLSTPKVPVKEEKNIIYDINETKNQSQESSQGYSDTFFSSRVSKLKKPNKTRRRARVISDSDSLEDSFVSKRRAYPTYRGSNRFDINPEIIEISDVSDQHDKNPFLQAPQFKSNASKGFRKLNFLTYYSTHIMPQFFKKDIPLFLRLAHRQYQRRALLSNLPLVDFPWRKPIYFISLKAMTREKFSFHLSKSVLTQESHQTNLFKAAKNYNAPLKPTKLYDIPTKYHQSQTLRRKKFYKPSRLQKHIDFFSNLKLPDKEIYLKRHETPDAFFYKFTEPGFKLNTSNKWQPEELESYHQLLKVYNKNNWPIGKSNVPELPFSNNVSHGWGIFSVAIPSRNGQQCEAFFNTLISDQNDTNKSLSKLAEALHSNRPRDFTSYAIQSESYLKRVWKDPILHKYDRFIPKAKPRKKRKIKKKRVNSHIIIIPHPKKSGHSDANTWLQSRILPNSEGTSLLDYPSTNGNNTILPGRKLPIHTDQLADHDIPFIHKSSSVSRHNSLVTNINLQCIVDRLLQNTDRKENDSSFDTSNYVPSHNHETNVNHNEVLGNHSHFKSSKPRIESYSKMAYFSKPSNQTKLNFKVSKSSNNTLNLRNLIHARSISGFSDDVRSSNVPNFLFKCIPNLLTSNLHNDEFFDSISYVGSGQLIELMSYKTALKSEYSNYSKNEKISNLTINPLPILEIVGHTYNLELEWLNSENTMMFWGRWLLKKATSKLDLISDHTESFQIKPFKAYVSEIFVVYKLFLARDHFEHGANSGLCISKNILNQLLILENHILIIHEQLLQQLKSKYTINTSGVEFPVSDFNSIQDVFHVHMSLLDWRIRYHLTASDNSADLKSSVTQFVYILIRYIIVFIYPFFCSLNLNQCALPIASNHCIMEGLNFLRFAIPIIDDSATDNDDDAFTFWNLINKSIFNQLYQMSLELKLSHRSSPGFIEMAWLLLSVVLYSSTANSYGISSSSSNSGGTDLNWHFVCYLFTWLSTDSKNKSSDDILPIKERDNITSFFTVDKILSSIQPPHPSIQVGYMTSLLHCVLKLNIHWKWSLDQNILYNIFNHFKTRGFLDYFSKNDQIILDKVLPSFLNDYNGDIPTLIQIETTLQKSKPDYSDAEYSPFTIFLCLIAHFVSILGGNETVNSKTNSDSLDLRLILKTVDKFISKISPTRKLNFEMEDFIPKAQSLSPFNTSHLNYIPTQLIPLISFISIRQLFFHSLSLKIKSLDVQLKYFIIRIKQVVGDWDALPLMALQVIFKGFFTYLKIGVKKANDYVYTNHDDTIIFLSNDVLQFISELIQYASKPLSLSGPQLKITVKNTTQIDMISEISFYLCELITLLIPLQEPKGICFIQDAFKLFNSIPELIQALSPYTTDISLRDTSINVLDVFIGQLVIKISQQPSVIQTANSTLNKPGPIIPEDFDDEDLDDELFELVLQEVKAPQTQVSLVQSFTSLPYFSNPIQSSFNQIDKSLIDEISKFFYRNNLHLRLARIIKLPSLIDVAYQENFIVYLRVYINLYFLLKLNELSTWNYCLSEFNIDLSSDFNHSIILQSHDRQLIIDLFWMIVAVDKNIITDVIFFEHLFHLWFFTIFDFSTTRLELLTQSLAKFINSKVLCSTYPELLDLFCGEKWNAFSHSKTLDLDVLLNLRSIEKISTEFENEKCELAQEIIFAIKTKIGIIASSFSDNVHHTALETLIQQFQKYVYLLDSFLKGLKRNIQSDSFVACAQVPSTSVFENIVTTFFELIPLLLQLLHKFGLGFGHPVTRLLNSLFESCHQLLVNKLLLQNLSIDSLTKWITIFSQLDYVDNISLRTVLRDWFIFFCYSTSSSQINSKTDYPKLDSATFAMALLPFNSQNNSSMWNQSLSHLRTYIYTSVLSPIFLDVKGELTCPNWLAPSLIFFDITLSTLINKFSKSLACPQEFMLLCSSIQAELDTILDSLLHLALCDPKILLSDPEIVESFFRTVSSIATYYSLVYRGNSEFFSNNHHWFGKLSQLVEITITHYHYFWINLMINNGPFGLLLADQRMNIRDINFPSNDILFNYTSTQCSDFLESLRSLLENHRVNFKTNQVASQHPSLINSIQHHLIEYSVNQQSLECLISVSCDLLIPFLPLWLSAAKISPKLKYQTLNFFNLQSLHIHHMPMFFTLLTRVVEKLGSSKQIAQLVINLFESLDSSAYHLKRWLHLSLPPKRSTPKLASIQDIDIHI